MNTPPSEIELKKWLAGQLSDILHEHPDFYWRAHTINNPTHLGSNIPKRIRETEWLFIVSLVEEKVPEELKFQYAGEVYNVTVPLDVQPFRATWQQRTLALMEILK